MLVETTLLQQRYEIKSLLGEGGFGRTYEGIDQLTQTPVAIKTISLSQMQTWQALDFFQREVDILKKLNHPKIPKYIDSFCEDTENDRTFYLVRELAIGESLANLVKKGWRATEAEIKNILEQLLEILVYLHGQDPPVIHRDIKPSNIIYQPDSQKVFLIDFGSVLQAVGSGGIGTFVGTYGYIAPEQLRGETTPQSDIYSVAMTLAFLLTGREPAELPRKELKLDLQKIRSNASNALLQWLEQANAPIPEDRFPSAQIALKNLRFQDTYIYRTKEIKPPEGSEILLKKTADKVGLFIPSISIEAAPKLNNNGVGGDLVLRVSLFLLALPFVIAYIMFAIHVSIFLALLTEGNAGEIIFPLWIPVIHSFRWFFSQIWEIIMPPCSRLSSGSGINNEKNKKYKTVILDGDYLNYHISDSTEVVPNASKIITRKKLDELALSRVLEKNSKEYEAVVVWDRQKPHEWKIVFSTSTEMKPYKHISFRGMLQEIIVAVTELPFIYTFLAQYIEIKEMK